MRARLSITFRCACLLVALAALALWVRSHHVSDSFGWNVARPPPPPAPTPASSSPPVSASNNVSDSLFLLLNTQDLATRNPYRSVKTVPGRFVIQQHPPFEVFV